MNTFKFNERRLTTRVDNRTVAANDNSFLPESSQAAADPRFGVGYGSSSGYISRRRYTQDWAPSRFSVR